MKISRKGRLGFSGKLGLRSKFILVSVSMILGIVSVLTVYFISIQRSMLRNELRNRAVSLSQNFAYNCGYPVLLEDMQGIRQMTMGVMNEEDVAFVQIRRADDSILLEEVRGLAEEKREEWERGHTEHDRRSMGFLEQADFLIIHAPIAKPADESLSLLDNSRETREVGNLGDAVIGFSLERTKELIVSSIVSTLLITVAIAVAGVVLALLMVQNLMKPLLSVTGGTREIAQGNLDYRVEVQRDDELGHLADSFNEMAQKLEDNTRALDEYSRNLERMVQDRTHELKMREEELTLILENNPAGILLVDDKTGRITWANSNASRILKGSKGQLEGRLLEECVVSKGRLGWTVAESGEAGDALEGRFLTAEGNEIPVLTSVSRINHKGREHLLNAFFDITEQKKLEAQLLQAQKMGAVGTLAGGIAHDFNNLLQAVSGYVELVLLGGNLSCEDRQYLDQVERSTQRGAELIKQLLTFSRKVESQLRPIDLNVQVEKISNLLARTLPKMIGIETELCSGLREVDADPAHLEQMIMNLAVNARDAMPNGGKLVFRTSHITLNEEHCKGDVGLTPGEYVLLSVGDTGVGMDKTTLEHIFEPFYTTKEVGKGTGLGLAMVYGIVKSHHGHIICSSEPGEGTIFQIYLPAREGESDRGEMEPLVGESLRGGEETVLLVDDDEVILAMGKGMLEQYGYQVITAASGEEAIEIFRAQREHIHLITLDLGMPGMGGYLCLKEVLGMDPDAKVIIASGYSDMGKRREVLQAGAKGFLGKPYRLHEILKMVREVLDESGAPFGEPQRSVVIN